MGDNNNLKDIGRINIEVEKKLNLTLSGDTNVYITPEIESKIRAEAKEKADDVFAEFRRILKKPNFVRVTDVYLMYINIFIKNGELKIFQLSFSMQNGKYICDYYGRISFEEFKKLDSIQKFVKIN